MQNRQIFLYISYKTDDFLLIQMEDEFGRHSVEILAVRPLIFLHLQMEVHGIYLLLTRPRKQYEEFGVKAFPPRVMMDRK